MDELVVVKIEVATPVYQCVGCKTKATGIPYELTHNRNYFQRNDYPPEQLIAKQWSRPKGWTRLELNGTSSESDAVCCDCAPIIREQLNEGLQKALWLISNPSTANRTNK